MGERWDAEMTIPDTHDKAVRETDDLLNEIVKLAQEHITCDVGLCIECYWIWRVQQTAMDGLRSIEASQDQEKRGEEKGMRQKRLVASEGRGWVDLQRYEEDFPGRVCLSMHGPRGGFLGNTWFSGQKLVDALAEIGFSKETERPDVAMTVRGFISGRLGREETMEALEGVDEGDFVKEMMAVIHRLAESDEVEDGLPEIGFVREAEPPDISTVTGELIESQYVETESNR